jgi:osmotically-inducible protein OsmY
MEKGRTSHSFYTPWYAADEEIDSWMNYIHRNLHHLQGEEVPFKDSEWNGHDEDATVHDEVLDALYENEFLDASKIYALVKDKTVAVSGFVRTALEKDEVTKTILALPNVWSFVNDLVVTDL